MSRGSQLIFWVICGGLVLSSSSQAGIFNRKRAPTVIPSVKTQPVDSYRVVETVNGEKVSVKYTRQPSGSYQREEYAKWKDGGWEYLKSSPSSATQDPKPATTPTANADKPVRQDPQPSQLPQSTAPKIADKKSIPTTKPVTTTPQQWVDYHDKVAAQAKATRLAAEAETRKQITPQVEYYRNNSAMQNQVAARLPAPQAKSLDTLMDSAGLGNEGVARGFPVDHIAKGFEKPGSGQKSSVVTFVNDQNSKQVAASLDKFGKAYQTEVVSGQGQKLMTEFNKVLDVKTAGDLLNLPGTTTGFLGAVGKSLEVDANLLPNASVIVDVSEPVNKGFDKYQKGVSEDIPEILASKAVEKAYELNPRKAAKGEDIAANGASGLFRRLKATKLQEGIDKMVAGAKQYLGTALESANKLFVASVKEGVNGALSVVHQSLKGAQAGDTSVSLIYDKKKAADLRQFMKDADALAAVPLKDGSMHYIAIGGKTPPELSAKMLFHFNKALAEGKELTPEAVKEIEKQALDEYKQEEEARLRKEAEKNPTETADKSRDGITPDVNDTVKNRMDEIDEAAEQGKFTFPGGGHQPKKK